MRYPGGVKPMEADHNTATPLDAADKGATPYCSVTKFRLCFFRSLTVQQLREQA